MNTAPRASTAPELRSLPARRRTLTERARDAYLAMLRLLMLGGVAVMFWAVGVLGYQVFLWLRDGQWTALPARLLFIYRPAEWDAAASQGAAKLLRMVPSFATSASDAWLRHPQSWLGLHMVVIGVLDAVSVPGAAFVVGLLLAAGGTAIAIRQEERHQGR
jgi:hypothetical protein